jgi:hypothetical protein
LVDSNLSARTGGHELEKELSHIVLANKTTDQNAKPFNRITRHASKDVGKSKKMMWISKVSTPIKVELITQTSIAKTTIEIRTPRDIQSTYVQAYEQKDRSLGSWSN